MQQRISAAQQRQANSVARRAGYGRATKVVVIPGATEPRVVEHTPFGYRKRTTGEYVPPAYRANFGWRNTYYQPAVTVVELPA